jgi:hypothetical protein
MQTQLLVKTFKRRDNLRDPAINARMIIKCTVQILIVVLPCMLTITQLVLQQNAHFYY